MRYFLVPALPKCVFLAFSVLFYWYLNILGFVVDKIDTMGTCITAFSKTSHLIINKLIDKLINKNCMKLLPYI